LKNAIVNAQAWPSSVKCNHEHHEKTRQPSQLGRHHPGNDRHPAIRTHGLGSDGRRRAGALLHPRPQHQIQFEVFMQDAVGAEEGGGVVFATSGARFKK